ncbi:hypothetical protein SD81_034775 [Tolypothrix campylonemoides VB511288]|nr:hypothetical protein SD81_034775 [Tolypothrix campylonemoides VB511288]
MLLWKRRSPQINNQINKLIDGIPMVVVEDGRSLKDRMHKARLQEEDILMVARQCKGFANGSN